MADTFVRVREGMEVWSVDGHKLGKVVAVQTDTFVIEKGVLFPRDDTISSDTIEEIREGKIVLSRRREELAIEKGLLESLGFGGQEPLQSALRLEEAERAEKREQTEEPVSTTIRRDEVEAIEVPTQRTGTTG